MNTAIDDATSARALKIEPKHNRESAIEFVNYVRERFPYIQQLKFIQ